MEYRTGTEGIDERPALRLVDAECGWEPDPAIDTADAETLDELADLFIGEECVYAPPHEPHGGSERGGEQITPSPPDAPIPAPKDTVSLEAVITGHLPVRGAVWVRAYAAGVARSVGEPVVLVRVSSDRTCVELVGTSAESDPVGDIPTAIRAAGCAAGRWLLHFDELDQADLLRTGPLDRVTVLSGADEPAIVSAYRLIKSIAEASGSDAALAETGEPSERVGVAIVGADPSNTTRATGRLVDATRQFLGVELDVRPGVPRVQSASVALLGDTDRRIKPAEVLSMIVDRPRDRAEPTPGVVAASDASASGGVPGDRPDPVSLVGALATLDLPCPVAPEVVLATDAEGRLHLAAWWTPGTPGELLRASAWARVNRPLLERLHPALRAGGDTPALHIVCEDLGVAADLRGAGIALHLARPAERTAPGGWFCGRVD